MRPLDIPCGEQRQAAISAKVFMFAERDKFMSEEKKSGYFEELNAWVDSTLETLGEIGDEDLYFQEVEKFKKAMREKMLESYRNGQKAGPRSFPKSKGSR